MEQDTADRGDVLVRGFWNRQIPCIIDIRVTDTDANSYSTRSVDKVLRGQEKDKKRKYLTKCLNARTHFTPFVVSVDGVLAPEAKAFVKRLCQRLAERWERPYSQIIQYVNVRLSLAILRATTFCIRDCRTPLHSMAQPIGDDGAALGLYSH